MGCDDDSVCDCVVHGCNAVSVTEGWFLPSRTSRLCENLMFGVYVSKVVKEWLSQILSGML